MSTSSTIGEFTIRAIIAFSCSALTDVFWTKYISFAAQKKKHWIRASFWSAMILLPGVIGVFNMLEDRRMVVFSMLGAFAGTAVTLLSEKDESDGTT